MGYFDGLANSAFKRDAEGRDLFFPNGMFGKGRVLPDAETAAELRGKVVRSYKYLMFAELPLIGVLVNVPHGILIAIVLGALSGFGTSYYFRQLTRDLPIAGERLGYMEAQRNAARGHSYFGLVVLAFLAWIMTTGGVILLVAAGPDVRWIGLGATVFFGACLAFLIWMIIAKKRQASAEPYAPALRPGESSAVLRNDRSRGGA